MNRYIYGGEGTAEQAAAAIGFAIYRTDEMADLISYMRKVIDSAVEGNALRDQRMAENVMWILSMEETTGECMYFYFRSQWTYRAVWKLWHG